MKWSESYATGVSQLDEQHKKLFQMSEDFRAAVEAGRGESFYGLFLEFLDQYVRAHFAYEDRCMEQYRCPFAQRNREAHAELIQVVEGYRQRYSAGAFGEEHARGIADTVDRWLAMHIGGIDVHLKDYVDKP